MDDDVNILFDRMTEVTKENRKLVEERAVKLFGGSTDLLDTLCIAVKEIRISPTLEGVV